jgi:hypothetical protein
VSLGVVNPLAKSILKDPDDGSSVVVGFLDFGPSSKHAEKERKFKKNVSFFK